MGEHMRVDTIGTSGHFDDAYQQRPCCTANVSMCAVCLNQSTTCSQATSTTYCTSSLVGTLRLFFDVSLYMRIYAIE